jgi:hypothetical protein
MPLKILIAGCAKEEREQTEALVRAVIGRRAAAESWMVSLVKVGGRWSATLDGPDQRLKAVTFAVPAAGLRDAILDALRNAGFLGPAPGPGATPGAAGPPRGPSRERRDRYACGVCRQVFQVTYEMQDGEPQEMVPIACPHCWQLNRVGVGKDAAEARVYRAEKA